MASDLTPPPALSAPRAEAGSGPQTAARADQRAPPAPDPAPVATPPATTPVTTPVTPPAAQPAAQPAVLTAGAVDFMIAPPAGPARMRRRHRSVIFGFLLLVLLPLALLAGYFWGFARDQYGSSVGFTLRREEASASPAASGLSAMLGAGSDAGQSRVLYEYIRSSTLVAALDAALDLRGHYSQGWPRDPLYSLPPDASPERLTRFWLRMTRIAYDETSGLLALDLRAFDPDYARDMARLLVQNAESMINALNETARRDAMRYASEDLESAIDRLRRAQEALIAFRTNTHILDPAADLQGRSGILNSLQGQLAQSYIDFDLLSSTDDRADPRRGQIERRIGVIRDRIEEERRSLTAGSVQDTNSDYPTLLARYAGLMVDVEVAEQLYRAARASYELTRSRAERNSLYLATYIPPTRASLAEYPSRFQILGLSALFLLMSWAIISLTWYSLRDRN